MQRPTRDETRDACQEKGARHLLTELAKPRGPRWRGGRHGDALLAVRRCVDAVEPEELYAVTALERPGDQRYALGAGLDASGAVLLLLGCEVRGEVVAGDLA